VVAHVATTQHTDDPSNRKLCYSPPLAAPLRRARGARAIILTMLIALAALDSSALGLSGSSTLGAPEIRDANRRALVHLAGILNDVVLARIEHDGIGKHAHDLALQLRRVDDATRRHQVLGNGQQHVGGVARAGGRQAVVGGGGGVHGAPARRDGSFDRLHVLRPPDHVAVALRVLVAHRVAEQRRVLVRHDVVLDDGHGQPREVAHRQNFVFWC